MYNNKGNKQQRTIEENFYNPYAFVPLSGFVFDYGINEKKKILVSQDVPFSDGISGTIQVKLKAQTPFCVRSNNGENCKVDRYFIPATSIKGMVRSVFEIITMSNIRNGIANNRYSMRDLHSNDYHLKSNTKEQHSGFLILFKGDYYIIKCQSWPVAYKEIEEDEGVDLKNYRRIDEKYNALRDGHIFIDQEGKYQMWFFSGFMNNKEHEYQFDIPPILQDKLIPLKKNEYDDFKFVHQIENENCNWKFWNKKIKNYHTIEEIIKDKYAGIVPCFFRTKNDKEGKLIVKDLGFSFLYRQPYDKKIHDCLPEKYKCNTFDMSQALFGYVNKDDSLKGRVQFTNTFIEDAIPESSETFILGSPKPTYYPFYLRQDSMQNLNTYFSNNATISGWKKTLVHRCAEKGVPQNKKSESSFIPLKADTEFTFKIHIHNLRKFEVGALLSALTFHNHKECFHSLGYAKPYGYGKMKVENITLDMQEINKESIDDYINCFENELCKRLLITKQNWLNLLAPLFTIASGQYKEKNIRYPDLNNKEFETIKNQKKSLVNFSPNK